MGYDNAGVIFRALCGIAGNTLGSLHLWGPLSDGSSEGWGLGTEGQR